MSMVICFEDQVKPAERILSLVQKRVPGVCLRFVSYKDDQGALRPVPEVAEEAYQAWAEDESQRAAFLVDLVTDPERRDIDYGLRVIRSVAVALKPSGAHHPVGGLLRNRTFLTVVVTLYPPTDNDLVLWWKEPGILPHWLIAASDVKSFLNRRAKECILPIVGKNAREALIPRLIAGWLAQAQQ